MIIILILNNIVYKLFSKVLLLIQNIAWFKTIQGNMANDKEMSGIYKFLEKTCTDVAHVALNLAMEVSPDVLGRINDRFNLLDVGQEDFMGMQKWFEDFYERNYNHEGQSLDDFKMGRNSDKWNVAALEMLLDFDKEIDNNNSSASSRSAQAQHCVQGSFSMLR